MVPPKDKIEKPSQELLWTLLETVPGNPTNATIVFSGGEEGSIPMEAVMGIYLPGDEKKFAIRVGELDRSSGLENHEETREATARFLTNKPYKKLTVLTGSDYSENGYLAFRRNLDGFKDLGYEITGIDFEFITYHTPSLKEFSPDRPEYQETVHYSKLDRDVISLNRYNPLAGISEDALKTMPREYAIHTKIESSRRVARRKERNSEWFQKLWELSGTLTREEVRALLKKGDAL